MSVLSHGMTIADAARDARAARWPGLLFLCVSLVSCFMASATARAQDYDIVTGSTTAVTVQGLRVELTNRWPTNPGYRPFRVRITPLVPSTDDRRLTVVVDARGYPEWPMSVRRDITVPAGSAVVTEIVSVPMTPSAREYSIVLFEEGIPLKTTTPIVLPDARSYWSWQPQNERFPRVLFAGNQLPDTGSLGKYFGASVAGGRSSQGYYHGVTSSSLPAAGNITAPPLPSAMAMRLDDLPTRWLDYTCLDVVCLSLEQLADLATRRPEAARALRDWTQAGGTLWIFGAGHAWEGLPKLDRLLGEPANRPTSASSASSASSAWSKPEISQFGKCPDWITWNPMTPSEVTVGEFTYDDQALVDAVWDWSRQKPSVPVELPFMLRDLSFGRVVALADADPFPGDPWQWGWIRQSMGRRVPWTVRHGFTYENSNPDFWDFLVPGVGLAPVTEFRVLITLFVLAIGPVNYCLLRRRRQLHLLVLTIPAGALLVSGGLFGYALIADGLGVKLRARSVTRIDQRRGEAVCWARLSYYAGMSPSGGLTFSDETSVFPYWPDEESMAKPRRQVAWDDGQRLTRGWLPARAPTQLFTIRSRPTQRNLAIEANSDGSDVLQVANHLGVSVETLVIRTHDGDYYWAIDLAAEAVGEARTVQYSDAIGRLRKIISDAQPSVPATATSGSGMFVFGQSRRYRYGWRPWGGNAPMCSLGSSLMERSVTTLVSSGDLTPGTYVAIVERQPELEPGTPRAREEDSFHIIIGEW